ncbi:type IV secretion protein Rhs [Saccharomonospora piscinae]|uniref:RHS repeat-associated core domain-containing protein n=1 Tax=Saccharomonospora piscinae TaxID=687388 RepID=UPI001105FA9F|nr:RHS repeat-associated core domain-containing protein [Saccharomonospora piscinae]TLW90729.1 type IV secretion protein Rhs [Saccharomonospora piscinae]
MAYADVEDPAALLAQDPGLAGGSSIEDAIADAGFQVQAVNWVWQKVVGEDLVSSIITPITGDFEKIAEAAAQWNNVRDALQAVRNNLNAGLEELRPAWAGDAAESFSELIGTTWTLGIEADAQTAKLIGVALSKVADGSKRACDQALHLIERLVNKLIEAAAMLPIPVVGWGRAVKLVYDGIQIYNAIMDLIDGIRSIIEGAQQVIGGITSVGTALSQLGGSGNLNSALNSANDLGQGVADVRDGASSVRDGATQASSAAGDVRTSTSSAVDNARGLSEERGATRETSPSSGGDGSATGTGASSGDGGDSGRPRPGSDNPARPQDPQTTRTPEDFRVCENDPVDIASGEVVLGQTDLTLPGVLPLVLRRTHISGYRAGESFGRTWAATVDQRLEFDSDGVVYVADDGMILVYPMPERGGRVLPRFGPRWPLRRTEHGYTVTRRGPARVLHFPAASASGTARLAAIADRNGNRIDIDRGPDGAVTAVRHDGGYHVDVATEQGRVSELRLRGQRGGEATVLRYGYDDTGALTEVVNSSGRAMRFDYDPEGRLTRWIDRNGEWYRYLYDSEGRCVANQGSGGFLNGTFSYDPGNRTTRFTDALGNITTYVLDERGNVAVRTDPLGASVRSEWDEHDRLVTRTDALGRTTHHTYDADGNLIAVTRPDGSRSSAEYNELGLPVTVTDPDGAVWRHDYDERGNLLALTDPTGATRRHTYDERGHHVATVDETGARRTVRTDAAGLPVAITDPAGATMRHVRDLFGRIVETVDPLGGRTRFRYNVEGRVVARTDPHGATEHWRYDGEGNTVSYTDAMGRATRIETTHFDLPRRQVLPDGSWLQYGYDANLRPTSVTTSHGLDWTYVYDEAGRLVRETDFNGRVLHYEYDPAGQLTARTNGAGETTRFSYDALGRVRERDAEGAVSRFEFDPAGRLVRAVNSDADVTLHRDALGRVLAERVNGRTSGYGYDAAGRRTLRRTPTGSESSWSYTANHRPAALHTGGRDVTFGYDAAGREIQRVIDGGTVLAQSWTPGHRLLSQTLSTSAGTPAGNPGGRAARLVQERTFHYHADGHLAAVDDRVGGPRRFELDPVGRITDVTGPGWREQYSYDALGNVAAGSWPGGDAAGPRQFAGNLVRSAGGVRYHYDAQGRLVRREKTRLSRKPGVWHYTWNAEDRLVGVITPDGARWRYRYDALGRRIAKQRVNGGGEIAEEVLFTWDGTVLAEQVHSSGTATTWDWAPGSYRPLTQLTRVRRNPADTASQEWIDQRFHAIVTDLAGTPTELVDAEGGLAWHAARSVWGATVSERAAVSVPLRFPGQYHDPESGLNYNYQRHYDPETGRYVSNDPLGLAPAANPHAYVPNPTLWLDPWGLAACNTYYQTRDEALGAAYDRAGIPRGTDPDAVWEVGNDYLRYGEPDYRHSEDLGTHGRYMQFETDNGSRVIAEHTSDPNAPGPHFHAGQPKIDPTREMVDFGWSDRPNSEIERYSQIGGSHHMFYGVAPPGS